MRIIPDDGSEPPDLSAVPKAEWKEVLRPLLAGTRRRAGRSVRADDLGDFHVILVELELDEFESVRRDIPTPTLPPAPSADAPPPRRQVNFRLGAEAHERLARVAGELGLTPTQLARLFVLRGVTEALRTR